MLIMQLAIGAMMGVGGIVALVRAGRQTGLYLLGLSLFNGLLASLNTLESNSSVIYGIALVMLWLYVTIGSVALTFVACSLAYDARRFYSGFAVAVSVVISRCCAVGSIAAAMHGACRVPQRRAGNPAPRLRTTRVSAHGSVSH